jgi:site-specific DNA-methyltransferase (adenine-specific)
MIDLRHGDCLEVLKSVPSNSIDLTVTSPPYDNLRTYNGYTFDFEGIAQELYRVTKDGGVVVWIVGDATIKGSESGTSFRQALYFMQCGFNLHDTMIWNKPNFSNPSKTRYHQIFEYMFIFSKGKNKTFNPIKDKKNKYLTCVGKNTMRLANGELVEVKKNVGNEFGMRTNVWNMNTVGQEMMCKRPPHPAMFPEKLAHDHIISWSNEGDTVLDCFLGSGTTGKMAKQLNRNFIGIEISQEYLDIAKERIEADIMTRYGT